MAKGATFSSDLLKLLFNTTTVTSVAQTAAGGATSLNIALHTADPSITAGTGTIGTQTASEVVYGGYSRIAVPRAAATPGFAVTANVVSPTANVTFPTGSSGSGTVTFWSIGIPGGNYMLYSGPVSPTIPVGSGTTPVLLPASTVTET